MEEQQKGRQWRKTVKKKQRKKKRQHAAKERDKQLKEEEAARQDDAAFQQWQQYQNEMEEFERLVEERKMQAEEEAWQRRELIAQKQFRLERQRLAVEESKKEVIRQQQEKELAEREAAKHKRCEAHKRRVTEAAAEFERIMQVMENYLTAQEMLEPPAELRRFVDTRPDEKICEFYERTNCCRFGVTCIFNHRRPLLSSIIVIRNFFKHPLLDESVHSEYEAADAALELDGRDMREDYDAFFEDVVSEMESFGRILNFRTSCNAHPHLRGHVFVEYVEERSALKAFIKLQGRYYASKRLNVEFSSLQTWRGAICGLSMIRKCPKAQNCNYLHVFRNPENKYNTLLEYTQPTAYSLRKTPSVNACPTPALSWNDASSKNYAGSKNDAGSKIETSRSWRWSESPELDLLANRDNPDTNAAVNNKTESDKRTNDQEDCENHAKRAIKKRSSRSKTRNRTEQRVSRSKSREHSKSSLYSTRSSSREEHHSERCSRSKSKESRMRKTSRSRSGKQHETSRSKTKDTRKRKTSKSKNREFEQSCAHSNSRKITKSKNRKRHESSSSAASS